MSTASMSARWARLVRRPRSKTGCTKGRSLRQSRGVTRCTVLRISATRTARRSVINRARDQLFGAEPLQSRPQADVGRAGGLCLHADQDLNRFFDGQLLATQQHLSLQHGAIERTQREHGRVGHRYQSSFEKVRVPPTGSPSAPARAARG
jgi:hypothetical protein